jgi:hypothetical protein
MRTRWLMLWVPKAVHLVGIFDVHSGLSETDLSLLKIVDRIILGPSLSPLIAGSILDEDLKRPEVMSMSDAVDRSRCLQ